ncbi:unnamed protein product [Porites lobata]|uniref:G-protein coupled receptors family 1 profile domain-containing protein n=1 Tax=Porites lobata TaxID=104759 RepID=A0ABN8N0U8_9CNID|nr:unnamed protein product [Porites lobata]
MENSSSEGATNAPQDWCGLQSHQDDFPVIVVPSLITNAVINSILACMTVIGNILILTSLRKTTRVHTASKALYCSLALSDLSVGVFVQPLFVVRLLVGKEGLIDLCRIMGTIVNVAGVISVGVSLQTLSVISVDRVLAIRLKMRYKEVATISRIRAILAICWFFSTSHALTLFLSPALFSLFQILGIVMCVTVSTISYVIIFRSLRTLQLQVQNYGPGDEASTNAFNVKRFKKSVSTALWVYASLLVCYLPFMFSVAARMSLGFGATFLAIQWFTVSLLYMNSALNPVRYCWKIPEEDAKVRYCRERFCELLRNITLSLPLSSFPRNRTVSSVIPPDQTTFLLYSQLQTSTAQAPDRMLMSYFAIQVRSNARVKPQQTPFSDSDERMVAEMSRDRQGLQDVVKDCFKRAVKDNDDLRADILNKPVSVQR